MPVITTVIPSIASTDTPSTWLVSANLSYSRILDIVILLNSIEKDIFGAGASLTLADLKTTDKTSIVESINSLYDEFSTGALIQSITGVLASLTTTNKTTLVGAINELDGEIGNLDSLSTTDKSSIVNAINEINGSTSGVGTLTNLNTSNKSDLVSALNEVILYTGHAVPLITSATSLSAAINEISAKTNTNTGSIASLSTTLGSNVLLLDGTKTMAGNILMGSQKITGLADGTNASDAVTVQQVPSLAGIGTLASLNTTDKSNVVNAINEVFDNRVVKTSDTGSAVAPSGTTAERDGAPVNGYFRYNKDTHLFEGFVNGVWTDFEINTTYAGGGSFISTLDTPTVAPTDQDTYLVIATATGAWVGQEGNLASWDALSNSWVFITPTPNALYVDDLGSIYVSDSTSTVTKLSTSAKVYTQSGEPLTANVGDFWFDTDVDTLFMKINDGISDIWLDILNAGSMGLITTADTVNVPADFASIQDAIDFYSNYQFSNTGSLTITVDAGTYTGVTTIGGHIQGDKITITGAALTGAFPIETDFTGVTATDEAMLRSKFATILEFSGDAINVEGNKQLNVSNILVIGDGTGSGFKASIGSYLTLSSCAAHGFLFGIRAFQNSGISLTNSDLVSSHAGSSGYLSATNSFLNIIGAIFFGSGTTTYGYLATDNSMILCNNSHSEGASLGYLGFKSSYLNCNGATSNNNNRGFASQSGSMVSTSGSTASNNTFGYDARQGSTILAPTSNTNTGNTTDSTPTFDTVGNGNSIVTTT